MLCFPPSGKQPGRGKEENSFTEKIRGFKGEKTCAAEGREGRILADLPERRDLSGKEGCGQSFIRIREKQKNKGMKDSRYPPPDAAGKGESI